MENRAAEITVINYVWSFDAHPCKLHERDSSCLLTNIADKLFELDSWILLTISFTEFID